MSRDRIPQRVEPEQCACGDALVVCCYCGSDQRCLTCDPYGTEDEEQEYHRD